MTDLKTEYICASCARQSATCCSMNGVDAGECFPLSLAEILRIAKALQKDEKLLRQSKVCFTEALPENLELENLESLKGSFFVESQNTSAFLKAMYSLFPRDKKQITEIFEQDKNHWRLFLPDGELCVFLGEQGCLLPTLARPWFCKIYPFWMVGAMLRCFDSNDCLATRSCKSIADLLNYFDTDKKTVVELLVNLKKDWGISG